MDGEVKSKSTVDCAVSIRWAAIEKVVLYGGNQISEP
jgi:hypothetical protein